MKIAWIIVAVLLGYAANSAYAAESLPLGLVNVDRILKEYKQLNDKIDPLKAEAKEFEGSVQVRQAEMEAAANQLRQTQPGSPDFQRLQAQLVKMQADFQQYVAKGRHDLQQKEAK